MLKLTIFCLRFLNILYYHFSTLLEKRKTCVWASELSRYFKVTPDKIINQYQQKRPQTALLWSKKKRKTKEQIHSFYQETDYFIYRQTYFHRHKSYLDIALALLLKPAGKFCEYGGGVGPITNKLINFFPNWQYHITDLDCPVLSFAKWRFKNKRNVSFSTVTSKPLPLKDKFDVIVCHQVLEHVTNPLDVVKHFVDHLNSNGWLYLDFIYEPGEENIEAGAKQRKQVLKFLRTTLKPICKINPNSPKEGYGLYIKK
ncbi:class I SAM-dependent methyltransferase [Patescibacteria group bacterium]|nr:class I SAM-dependent methyltransferase [Patescibacteria group bacterium]